MGNFLTRPQIPLGSTKLRVKDGVARLQNPVEASAGKHEIFAGGRPVEELRELPWLGTAPADECES